MAKIMKRWKLLFSLVVVVPLTSILAVLPPIVDREAEREEYPGLQNTEALRDGNILEYNERLGQLGALVIMSREDRATAFAERENPYDMNNLFRFIRYTPRNTYVRYVQESFDFILVGMGEPEDLMEEIQRATDEAARANVNVPALEFQNRDGIELTQFEFIYDHEHLATREAIGSRRKSLTLFFRPGEGGADRAEDLVLDAVVTRVVDDNFREDKRFVQVIVDPTPLEESMDNVWVFQREGERITDARILGTMENTPTNPHRLNFKRNFYNKLVSHYDVLYTMVDNYANTDDNRYNRELIRSLNRSMEY